MIIIWDPFKTSVVFYGSCRKVTRHFLGRFSGSLGVFCKVLGRFWGGFGQVLGRLTGAWCESGQADDSVDSLMHGHTMWQSRHGWKREAAAFYRAPSPTPTRLQKLTTTKENFSLRKFRARDRQTPRLKKFVHEWLWLAAFKTEFGKLAERCQVVGLGGERQGERGGFLQPWEVYKLVNALKVWHQWLTDGFCFQYLSLTSPA